jgi:hypothetical protein
MTPEEILKRSRAVCEIESKRDIGAEMAYQRELNMVLWGH